MNKKIIVEKSKHTNRVEMWKLNKKGFYNFIGYLTEENIKQYKKQYKRYEIIDKQNCLSQIGI